MCSGWASRRACVVPKRKRTTSPCSRKPSRRSPSGSRCTSRRLPSSRCPRGPGGVTLRAKIFLEQRDRLAPCVTRFGRGVDILARVVEETVRAALVDFHFAALVELLKPRGQPVDVGPRDPSVVLAVCIEYREVE